MEISKTTVLVISILLVGKACGYSEDLIIGLVKYIIGFEIFINAKVIIKTAKKAYEFVVELFTKN